jgi:hypothetical protein
MYFTELVTTLTCATGVRQAVTTCFEASGCSCSCCAYTQNMLLFRYPTVEEGSKKGILLIVTAGKDGALNGGPDFMKAVGDSFIDSIISENIPIFTQACCSLSP